MRRQEEVTRENKPSVRRPQRSSRWTFARLWSGRGDVEASEPNIERAGPAVGATGFLEAEHDRAQVGLAQPLGSEPSQDAAFMRPLARLVQRSALAGDDDDQPRAARLRMAQEPAQRLMRLGLGQPMQIERGVDRGASAREFTLEPPFDWRERRRGGLRRSACRGLGCGSEAEQGPRAALTGFDASAGSPRAAAQRCAQPRSRARSPRRSGASNAAGAAAFPSRLFSSRQKHDEVGPMTNGAGASARRVAAAEEDVRARRAPRSPSRCPGRS